MTSPSQQHQALIAEIKQLSKKLQFPCGTLANLNLRELKSRKALLLNLVEVEAEPTSTLAKELIKIGIELPAPKELDDSALKAKLTEVLDALTHQGQVFEYHEHLTDRQFYDRLWNDILNRPTDEFRPATEESDEFPRCQTHWDLLDDGSPESLKILNDYYGFDF